MKASTIWALVLIWLIIGFIVAVVRNPNIIVQILMGPLSLFPGIRITVG